jgi:hypothetical protein
MLNRTLVYIIPNNPMDNLANRQFQLLVYACRGRDDGK